MDADGGNRECGWAATGHEGVYGVVKTVNILVASKSMAIFIWWNLSNYMLEMGAFYSM